MKNSENMKPSNHAKDLKVVDIKPMNTYDDGNIPQVDLPQKNTSKNSATDIIPDEVPRKDGPGGESGR